MNKKKILGLFGIGLLVTCFNLIIGIFMIKIFWSNIAELLFPKLLEAGQINTSMSFLDAFWIGLFLYVIIRAFSGNLLKVTNKNNKTTIKMGDSEGSIYSSKDSEDEDNK